MCLDITWKLHSLLSEKKVGHSSAAVLGTLHHLGGYNGQNGRNLKTEHLVEDKWTTGFGLSSSMIEGCAVVSSPGEMITIAGDYEDARVMYHYNVTSGDATKIEALPPTQAKLLLLTIYP